MRSHLFALLGMVTGSMLWLILSAPVVAQDAEAQLAETVRHIEETLDARVGVMISSSASNWNWAHRANERFLMNSTFKTLLCGAILHRADAGILDLNETVPVRQQDILSYAPVTETRIGTDMSVQELCLATLDMSDNTAANMLIDRLGGPQAVTGFLRSIDDPVSRLDRLEPELNNSAPGDPRDTTTPAAMVSTWKGLLSGHVLSPASRAQLFDWMSHGGVTAKLLRNAAPENWIIADKSGAGRDTRNLVAMVKRPDDQSFFVAIYLHAEKADFATRNSAVKKISAAVVEVLAVH